MQPIVIWQPRYWDRKVLVSTYKVKSSGKSYVIFCGDRILKDLYSFDNKKVREECDITSNGKIMCFNIPLEWLINEGELTPDMISLRDAEYLNFKNKMKKSLTKSK